jgi:hypothetical protein
MYLELIAVLGASEHSGVCEGVQGVQRLLGSPETREDGNRGALVHARGFERLPPLKLTF